MSVEDRDDVIIISDDGIIIRIPVADISVQSRYAGGVRVMRVPEGSRIVSLCRAPYEEAAEEGTPDGEAQPEGAADPTAE